MLDDVPLSKTGLFLPDVSIPQHPDHYWRFIGRDLIFVKMRLLNAFAANSLPAEAGDTAALCFTTAALTRRSDAGWNKHSSQSAHPYGR